MGRKEREESWRAPASEKQSNCKLCEKTDRQLTFHHLIPKTLHDNKWFKKNFTVDELKSGVYLCRQCHNAIHNFIDEKTMGREYNTWEKILCNEKVQTYIPFAKKQK